MVEWLPLSVPLTTCAYAVYAVRRWPENRSLGIAVLVSGGAIAGGAFAPEPLLAATCLAPSFSPFDDVRTVLAMKTLVHFALFLPLALRSGSDDPVVPGRRPRH